MSHAGRNYFILEWSYRYTYIEQLADGTLKQTENTIDKNYFYCETRYGKSGDEYLTEWNKSVARPAVLALIERAFTSRSNENAARREKETVRNARLREAGRTPPPLTPKRIWPRVVLAAPDYRSNVYPASKLPSGSSSQRNVYFKQLAAVS